MVGGSLRGKSNEERGKVSLLFITFLTKSLFYTIIKINQVLIRKVKKQELVWSRRLTRNMVNLTNIMQINENEDIQIVKT